MWNGRELLERLFDSLDAQTLRPETIIAVDNASSDGAAELAEQRGAKLIRMGHNAGFAAAVNRGISESASEWIALVNNDVELDSAWIERLTAACRAANVWFATGKILNSRCPSLLDGSFDCIARSGCAWRVGNGRDSEEFALPGGAVAMVSGTAALFRNQLFDRIGLFDTRFESYLEDVDLGVRAAAAGLSGIYVPGAVCHHYGSASTGAWSSFVVKQIARNQIFLVAKHYSEELVVQNMWAILIGQGLWGMLALRHGQLGAWLSGVREGLRAWGRMRTETPGIRAVLEKSERDIYRFQKQSGFDTYWRWYFRLAGRGAE